MKRMLVLVIGVVSMVNFAFSDEMQKLGLHKILDIAIANPIILEEEIPIPSEFGELNTFGIDHQGNLVQCF